MTEIYTSTDNQYYHKLDIDDDEAIVMRYILKDVQDVSKVYSPYSQSFTFKATPSVLKALGYFGDTSVVRITVGNRYYCKVYTNGILNLTGILILKEASYVDNKISDITAEFGTFMTDLKKRVKDDKINQLGSFLIDYSASKIPQYMRQTSAATLSGVGVKWYIPFMSNRRVWSYDDDLDSVLQDNIHWRSNTNHNSDKFVNDREVRPALSLSTIAGLIAYKYNLNILTPLLDRPELSEAYVWCNNEKMENKQYFPFKFPSNYITDSASGFLTSPRKYVLTSNISEQTLKITRNPLASSEYDVKSTFTFELTNKFNDRYRDTTGRLKITRKDTDEVLHYEEFTTSSGKKKFYIIFTDDMFVSDVCEFKIMTSFDDFVIHKNAKYSLTYKKFLGTALAGRVTYKSGPFGGIGFTFNDTENTTYGKRYVDLIESLPEMNVIDFLSSYLKTFNLQIFDTSPNNDKLFFLTPFDINTVGNEYSKATLDYTQYVDTKSYAKKSVDDFNKFNFKHADSKYRSNVDYKVGAGIEYGQLVYPETTVDNEKEYKVETNFSIIPPVFVANTDNMITTYGFNSEAPEIDDYENLVYQPNYGELTLFYKPAPIIAPSAIAVTSCTTGGQPSIEKIFSYMPAIPYNSVGNSLAFSIVVFNNIQYTDTLFKRGYQKQIERMLNQNCMAQTFTINLPFDEIYLNDATNQQGSGNTPEGFRLQNDIIIGETLYSILDASIDIKSGKSKITLLNY